MISFEELDQVSRARIRDARRLFNSRSYDGALYICGYSVEIALKAIVCKALGGEIESKSHVPSTSEEFQNIAKLKTHNLEELLDQVPALIKTDIKSKYFAEWSTILKWNPGMRYAPIKKAKVREEANETIRSAEKVLRYLWRKL